MEWTFLCVSQTADCIAQRGRGCSPHHVIDAVGAGE
jgi:hypothetical protein